MKSNSQSAFVGAAVALFMILNSCAATTTPSTATITPAATCPFGSTTITLRDTVRTGCAVVRFTTLGQVNASWFGTDTIPFLNTTTTRGWNIVLACPAAVGTYQISNQAASKTTVTIEIGQDTYSAINSGNGTVTITQASSTNVSGSFNVTASGYAATGTFSFVPTS